MKTLASFFLLVASLSPLSARAELPPAYLTLGYGAQVLTDRSWDFVDGDDHLPLFRLTAGYSFGLQPGVLDLDAGYRAGGSSQISHASLPTRMRLRGVEVGGTYRVPVWTRFHPYGRLSSGWDWVTLNVNGAELQQTVSNIGGALQAGIQGRFPVAPGEGSPLLVLDLGVGYAVRPAYRFDSLQPRPAAKPGTDDIPNGGVNLGALPMSGIVYALSLGLHL